MRGVEILVTGAIAGSFLGVLIRRLPTGAPIAVARSRCEHCGHRLGLAEMVPVVSFLLQRGNCRACGAAIAPMHLAVELAAVAVAGTAAAVGSGGAVWAGCALGWMLLALAWIDAEHFWLPDVLTLPLLVGGLAATGWLAPGALADHAAASVLAYVALRALNTLYRHLRGRDGLGQGDAKLLAAGGAWLGMAALPTVLLLAALLGLLVALVLRLRGREIGAATALPFGPPLAGAIWAIWLWSAAGL